MLELTLEDNEQEFSCLTLLGDDLASCAYLFLHREVKSTDLTPGQLLHQRDLLKEFNQSFFALLIYLLKDLNVIVLVHSSKFAVLQTQDAGLSRHHAVRVLWVISECKLTKTLSLTKVDHRKH